MTMNISSINATAGFTQETISSRPSNESAASSKDAADSEKKSGAIEQRLSKDINEMIQLMQGRETTVERSVHEETNQIIYKISDKASGELIREIPERKLLDMAAKLMELNGLLIDKKV
ncbi:flagellar protein FlaG [Paenibacillus tarimensis]|uniref:flagellar protein FlaG n=1 Tax=Paenibacillus tarimensis TaxID=416012 RepID=UPI001F47FD01|nr:flagellar protein FlaG [Paenibacillus tarimensis]MCF2944123.1 flagellar protein FlaG [Paenibacillus tarimensis]